jgi:transposase
MAAKERSKKPVFGLVKHFNPLSPELNPICNLLAL